MPCELTTSTRLSRSGVDIPVPGAMSPVTQYVVGVCLDTHTKGGESTP